MVKKKQLKYSFDYFYFNNSIMDHLCSKTGIIFHWVVYVGRLLLSFLSRTERMNHNGSYHCNVAYNKETGTFKEL